MKKLGIAGLALALVGVLIFAAGFIGARGNLSAVNGNLGPFRVQLADGHVKSGFFVTDSGSNDSSKGGIGGGRDKPMTTPAPVLIPAPDTAAVSSDQSEGSQRFKGSDVRKIKIDVSRADVVLCPTDAMNVYVLSRDLEEFRVELDKKGVLNIESRDMRTVLGINLGGSRPTLTVAVPATLEKLDVEVACGDIQLEDLSLGEVELDTALGDVYVSGIECSSAELSSDCGSLEARSVVSSGKLKVNAALGDAELEDCQAAGELKVKSSCGHVKVNGCTAEKAELESDMGDVSAFELSVTDKVKLDCDCGSIEVRGLSAGKHIEIENSMGSIEGTLAGSISDYSIESGTDLGSNNLPSKLELGNIKLKVFADCGSIDIDFEED